MDRRTLHDLRLARASTTPPIRFLHSFAADLTLTLTPYTPVLRSTFSSPLSGDSENIPQHHHSSCTYHQFDITSSLLSYFRSRQVYALQRYPQYPPIPHYYNWRQPCSYCNSCALSLFAFLRSFVRTPIIYAPHYVQSLSTIFVRHDPVSSRAPICSNTNDHDLMSKTYNSPQSPYKHRSLTLLVRSIVGAWSLDRSIKHVRTSCGILGITY